MAKVPADNDQPPGEPPPGEPLLRVVRGDASPQEIAALVAVLAARQAVADEPAEPTPSAWSDRSAQLRYPLSPGPGAWRRSALPR